MVEKNVKLGKKVKVFFPELVNIYGCEIGDESTVAPFVEITEGVVIGRRCKISSHSFLCTDVTLEDDVFISHGVMFTNDLYPKASRQVKYLPTLLKTGSSIGSGATILCGITIGCHAIIGAGSVVINDVPDFSIVAGNPARVKKQFSNLEELIQYMEIKQTLR